MMNRYIFVDMDGVLVIPHKKLLRQVNERFGTDYSVEEWEVWDYKWMEDEAHGEYIHRELWRQDNLYGDLEPIPGALEGLEKLEEIGEVIVLSSPMIGHADSKLRWLRDHNIGRKMRILSSNKPLIADGYPLIEDRRKTVRMHNGPSVLVDRPWNQGSLPEDTMRVEGWDEIPRAVMGLLDETNPLWRTRIR